MSADLDFLKTLRDKEAELVSQLEQSPLFKQIQGIRSTIALFKNGDTVNHENAGAVIGDLPGKDQGKDYPVNGTWEAKILFALNEIRSGYISDIMKIIDHHEPETYDEETLYKRVSQNSSVLKKNGKITGIKNGTSVQYFKK